MTASARSPRPTSRSWTRPRCSASPSSRGSSLSRPSTLPRATTFLTLNPDYPYIVYNDLPKVSDLKKVFPAQYADKPALVPNVVASK